MDYNYNVAKSSFFLMEHSPCFKISVEVTTELKNIYDPPCQFRKIVFIIPIVRNCCKGTKLLLINQNCLRDWSLITGRGATKRQGGGAQSDYPAIIPFCTPIPPPPLPSP